MNPKNTELLWNTFPLLYSGKSLPLTESLIPFGFEHGDGWFQIIWDLSEALEKEILALPEDQRGQCKAIQVKEKYATLRYYMTSGTDKMYALINEAELKSEITCEVCGNPGKIRGRSWVYTACDEHTKDYDKIEYPDDIY